MGKYLKLFETTAEYDAAKPNLILPNVSVCEDAPTVVHYNPLTPTPSHDYIEIGDIKWATMNIGANSVTDYGLYFQWGDTQGYAASEVGSGTGKKYFSWSDYKYSNNGGSSASDMTKYTCSGSSGSGSGSGSDFEGDGLCELLPDDDAATAAWGGSWRMPTTEEFATLDAAIDFIDSGGTTISGTNKLTTLSGVKGILVADTNDHSKRLFFPAAGLCGDGSVNGVGSGGLYWSSSLGASGVVYGRYLGFDSRGVNWQSSNNRYYGFAVRPVLA